MRMHSVDITDTNIKKIGQLFPNCLTERIDENGHVENAIDFDQLRQELSKEIVDGTQERYQFTWPDKKKAIRLANTPSSMTLRPYRGESVDFDNTENLYIEGDNLEVLKLLREDYLGKVKLIYIDPPYNTGSDFVYEDDFAQSSTDYIGNSGQVDELGNRLVQNTESNGRFHTDWLNMIYPRIKVARDFLSPDGLLCISIDSNEINNLKKVCTEVFGAQNYIAEIVIQNNPRGRQSDRFFATAHEYLVCVAKNIEQCCVHGEPLDAEAQNEYKYEDEIGRYRLLGLRQRGVASLREDRPEMFFPIFVNPDTLDVSLEDKSGWVASIPHKSDGREGRWMWGKTKCQTDHARLVAKMIEKRGEYDIFVKDYLNKGDDIRSRKHKTVWSESFLNNQTGTQEVKAILGGDYMSFPKSRPYIQKIVSLVDSDALIMDFFSGSATTAHAIMQMNYEDGGSRRFIMVQLPESIDPKSEACKAGYKTICDLGKERIRRAGKKILEEQEKAESNGGLFAQTKSMPKLDIGFRVLKLDSSNMNDVYYRPEEFSDQLIKEDNVKEDRSPEDLLFQVMLECNLPLSAKIQTEKIAGKEVYSVNNGYLVVCFDEDVNELVIKDVAKRKPYYFVMRDSSLESDNVADNFEQIFQAYSKETIRRIL